MQNELPPLARIDKLDISKFNYDEKIADFKILASKSAQKIAPILSDFAICDDCKKEFYDKYHFEIKNIEIINELIKKGLLTETDDNIYIKNIYTSNNVLVEFLGVNYEKYNI